MKIVSNIMHPTATAANSGLEAAMKAAEYWNSKCSIPQTLYRVIAGMPLGTMANSMRADDWASLSDAVVPMYTDEQNIRHQEEIGKYLSSAPASLIAEVVHMAGQRPSAPIEIISQTGTRAMDARGAAAWMTDMSNYVNHVTGHTNVVIQVGYGVPNSTVKPGSMAIVAYQDSTAEHDGATAKLRSDDGYLKKMDNAIDYFNMSSFFNILMCKPI